VVLTRDGDAASTPHAHARRTVSPYTGYAHLRLPSSLNSPHASNTSRKAAEEQGLEDRLVPATGLMYPHMRSFVRGSRVCSAPSQHAAVSAPGLWKLRGSPFGALEPDVTPLNDHAHARIACWQPRLHVPVGEQVLGHQVLRGSVGSAVRAPNRLLPLRTRDPRWVKVSMVMPHILCLEGRLRVPAALDALGLKPRVSSRKDEPGG